MLLGYGKNILAFIVRGSEWYNLPNFHSADQEKDSELSGSLFYKSFIEIKLH